MPPTGGGKSAGKGFAAAGSGPPAGKGFAAAAALSRGMGDLSMGGGLDEAQQPYEFQENNDKQDFIDDIDDFERRLAGGDGRPAAPKAPNAFKAPKVSSAKATGGAAKMTGADYVRSAHANAKGSRSKGKKATAGGDDEEDEDTSMTTQEAMSDLDRFEKEHGAISDDD